MALEERDHGYDSLLELVEDLKKRKVHVAIGVVGDDAGKEIPDADGLSMAGLAAVHEFGAWAGPGGKTWVPERAPIRKTLDEEEAKINAAAVRMVTRVAAGQETIESGLGKVGEFVSSQIRRTIQRGVEPENAPSTIARKKSSKPLIDTGLLIRSYTYQVREGED